MYAHIHIKECVTFYIFIPDSDFKTLNWLWKLTTASGFVIRLWTLARGNHAFQNSCGPLGLRELVLLILISSGFWLPFIHDDFSIMAALGDMESCMWSSWHGAQHTASTYNLPCCQMSAATSITDASSESGSRCPEHYREERPWCPTISRTLMCHVKGTQPLRRVSLLLIPPVTVT